MALHRFNFSRQSRLMKALLLSVLLHLAAAWWMGAPKKLAFSTSLDQPLEVEAISSAQLRQLRSLGLINGQKKGMLPLTAPQLAFTPHAAAALQQDQVHSVMAQQEIWPTFPWPDQVNLGAEFMPPQGVPYDELNSLERKFYAFKQRINRYYVATFMQTYQHFLLAHPNFNDYLATLAAQQLTGRLTYDEQGNLISIKIQRWSDDDHLETLFEQVLAKLNTIQNIPQEFLNHEQQLVIYYNFYLL